MQTQVACEVRNADTLSARVKPHYLAYLWAFYAVKVLKRGEMGEFNAAFASDQEEGKERMALDRVEFIVIEIRRIDLPEILLAADRRLSSWKLPFFLVLKDVSKRLLNVLMVFAPLNSMRVRVRKRSIEGIFSHQSQSFFTSLSIC